VELQLYSKVGCPFCWQVKIALKHFDIDYHLNEWKEPDKEFLLNFSPQGSSPVLVDDELSVWDSMAILYYLEEISAQNKTLFPGSIKDRTKARLLLTYSNSIVGKDLREVIFEKRSKPESEWDMERIRKGEEGWRKTLDWLEVEIEASNSFLSAGFSVADAALLPRFGLAEHYGVGVNEDHPKLFSWFQKVREQTVYLETLPW
jgi:glutathione S-transferase